MRISASILEAPMTVRLIAVLLLFAGVADAQFESGPSDVSRRVRIRIAFEDHGACDSSMRVVLIGSMGFGLAEGSVNSECTADFFDVPAGRYRVTVKGRDAANADDGEIEIQSTITQDLQVWAKHTQATDPLHTAGMPSIVSVADLRMPAGAAKEFAKASRLIEKQDWEKASEHIRKGLATYSNYAVGYNNLGAIYVRLGNVSQATEAFQKALDLDDHLTAAYVNLARISIIAKDYPGAEGLLQKAVELVPSEDADELLLLAYAELNDKHLDDAILTSRRGHSRQLKQHAFLHLVAANAFEQQNKIAESIQELQLYVSEEPVGPRTETVKNAIGILQTKIAAR
jgi:tetratricopeptide (TPR) repeat protein